MTPELLFVYGTLRPPRPDSNPDDSRYHPLIAPYIQHVYSARLPGAVLFDLGPYPGARPGKGEVTGELLEIPSAALNIVDQIEGHPHFFHREKAIVQLSEGEKEAWVYFAPESLAAGQPQIPSGDWLARARGEHQNDPGRAPLPDAAPTPADPVLVRVLTRLLKADRAWLASTRPDGRSRLRSTRPLWHNGRVYVPKRAGSGQLQDLLQNPAVTLAHPNPRHPILLEGWATPAQALRARLRPLFLDRYRLDIEPDYVLVEITPLRLRARGRFGEGDWRGSEIAQAGRAERGRPFPA